jgi:hypothetical protein
MLAIIRSFTAVQFFLKNEVPPYPRAAIEDNSNRERGAGRPQEVSGTRPKRLKSQGLARIGQAWDAPPILIVCSSTAFSKSVVSVQKCPSIKMVADGQ